MNLTKIMFILELNIEELITGDSYVQENILLKNPQVWINIIMDKPYNSCTNTLYLYISSYCIFQLLQIRLHIPFALRYRDGCSFREFFFFLLIFHSVLYSVRISIAHDGRSVSRCQQLFELGNLGQ